MDNAASDLQLIEKSTQPEFALARDFKNGTVVPSHRHSRAQLLHTLSGVMLVDTPQRTWAIPPGRGLWIPPGIRHSFTMRGHVSVRTLYVSAAKTKPRNVGVSPTSVMQIVVAPLVRELIIKAIQLGDSPNSRESRALVIALLMSELQAAAHEDLSLPWPNSPPLKKFANQLRAHPSDRRSLLEIASEIGVSTKTFARRFQTETGLAPDAWRRHARMLAAVAELRAGNSVTKVAEYLGFESLSSFTAAFRSLYGMTPSQLRRQSGEARRND